VRHNDLQYPRIPLQVTNSERTIAYIFSRKSIEVVAHANAKAAYAKCPQTGSLSMMRCKTPHNSNPRGGTASDVRSVGEPPI